VGGECQNKGTKENAAEYFVQLSLTANMRQTEVDHKHGWKSTSAFLQKFIRIYAYPCYKLLWQESLAKESARPQCVYEGPWPLAKKFTAS